MTDYLLIVILAVLVIEFGWPLRVFRRLAFIVRRSGYKIRDGVNFIRRTWRNR
jgi:hypothetical protein